MAKQFEDQGGAASSSPSALKRWLGSRVMRAMTNLKRRDKLRRRAEQKRKAQKRPHQIEYFHQVDDAYSHLAAQVLQSLSQVYEVEVVAHLAAAPTDKNAPEPELLLEYARYDSAKIALQYALKFPQSLAKPSTEAVQLAGRILAAASASDFAQRAVSVGAALWGGDTDELQALEQRWGSSSLEKTRELTAVGSARRATLGHYSGAMFYYEGEWYWGIDRLYHLEHRLRELAAVHNLTSDLLAPRPAIEKAGLKDDGRITLEFYPSLRSPYTSIIYDATLAMARDMGVNLLTRPVMPMVMRGVPLTRNKGVYITSDVAREAEAMGLQWGAIYDPIGEPVRKAFSLYPYAQEKGRAEAFLRAFLQAAWFKGINTNSRNGLRWVIEEAGLSWDEAQSRIMEPGWEEMVESNRLAMYECGLWGVPSYRILDQHGEVQLAVWGQDRLWLVSQTIQAMLRQRKVG